MFFKRLLAFITVLILIFSCIGCSDDNNSAIIYYGINEPPVNIDPQCAESVTELMLVKNLYEGLMREDADGKIVNGVIDSFDKQGDVYTFKIKKDAVWSDGTPLTANDFEFGITRALTPSTNSPSADCLYSIKNAKAVHQGRAGASTLGVEVIDQNTLVITTEAGQDVLYALTTAPAMPCNKEFFDNAIGRYGMSLNTVLCNGTYKLRKWALEDFAMRIVKNNNYTGQFVAKNAAVYFSKNKEYTNLECLDKNYIDIAEIPTTDYSKAQDKGYNLTTIKNKVLIIGVGKSYTKEMRTALFSNLITANDFESFNKSYSFADQLFPAPFKLELEKVNYYNAEKARNIYNSEIKKFDKSTFPANTIYYYGDTDTANIVKCIAAHWQQNLGVYINISPVTSNSEAKSYALNDYGIGVYCVEVNQANTARYLENFTIDNTNKTPAAIQDYVYSSSYTLPISFFGSCFAYSDKLSNLKINSVGGCIDFSQVTKKN